MRKDQVRTAENNLDGQGDYHSKSAVRIRPK